MFEEFLFTWQDRLRKLEQPTAMSVKLQGEVDKYKVDNRTVSGITYQHLLFSLSIFIMEEQEATRFITHQIQKGSAFGKHSENVMAISLMQYIL